MVVLVKISASYQKDGKYESPPPILRHPPLTSPPAHSPTHHFTIFSFIALPFSKFLKNLSPFIKGRGENYNVWV